MEIEKLKDIRQRKSAGLNNVATAVMPIVKNILGKKGMIIADILTIWEQIVGEEMAAYSLPRKIDFKKNEKSNGIIHIVVPGGAFALELQHRENFLLEKINAYFGYQAVTGMRIIQDANLKIKIKEINQPKVKKSLVSLEEQNYINSLTEEIIDPELKNTLVRLGESVFNQNHE